MTAQSPPSTISETAASVPRRAPLRQYELVERVKAYDPDADEDLLNRAYVFAMKAHGAQLRASGDPYFHHPVEVAGILTNLRLDSATIATALLHDTVEDTSATLDEIRRLFGPTIARLVDGVTKLNKIELQSPRTEQAENFRKLVLAMSEDIRVLLVKLADRLHNMRTLHFIKDPEKRKRIALETMEIYAPLAERIGMEQMKAELEDLAFAELWPDVRASIVRRLEQLRPAGAPIIERIIEELRATLAEAGIEAEITGREKSPVSIWRKMQRKNVEFEQLSDIMAFRVLVDSVATCYAALGAIHGRYKMVDGRFKDFISTPKPNGYRSLHTTILGPEGRKIEVQIRTHEMHEVCEYGVAAHWIYKQGTGVTEGRRYRWIRELLEILEHAPEPEEFLEHTKLEMYSDQVFCFTPKGDLIALPRGATPVDFAYAVHTEIGDHCVGAKVDGRLVQLRYRLQNGDQVEIITARNATPSPAWERFVVTGKARARIRRFLRLRQRATHIEQGREALQKAARAEGLTLGEARLERALEPLRQKTVDDLLAAVGEGSLAPRTVLEAIYPELKREAPARAGKPAGLPSLRRPQTPPPVDCPIIGLEPGIAFHLTGCCRPIPGDPIVGIVRTGRGVSIHRAECPLLSRSADLAGRAIDLAWNDRAPLPRAIARLGVTTIDKPGVLGAVSTAIGRQNANIVDLKFGRRSGELVELLLDIEVSGLSQLQQIMGALTALDVVCGVERKMG